MANAGKENLRRLLLAAVPLLTRVMPVPPILQPMTCGAVMAHITDMAEFNQLISLAHQSQSQQTERARPEQGGQRITEEWLRSLKNRDCQWRFRFVFCSLSPNHN
jgi:hypothetical protein